MTKRIQANIGLFVFVFLLPGCHKRAQDKGDQIAWPNTSYSKVVGYFFENPSAEAFGLVGDNGIDEAELKILARKHEALESDQVQTLLKAVFACPEKVFPAACYNPHHVFVFYSDKNKPVGAIEVCFGCDNIHIWPDKSTDFHHDFASLAKLVVALGMKLSPSGKDLNEYLQNLKDRKGE